jgi:protein-S-isoprenylcysteine O-methyltransferase Ste14
MTLARSALVAAFVAAIVVGLMLAIAAAVRWWNGEPLALLDWIALGALPLLAWLYVTKVSVFRPAGGCLTPPDDERPAGRPRSS